MKGFEIITRYIQRGESDMYDVTEVGSLVRCKDCKHRPIPNGISHPLAPKLDGWSDYVCPCICDDEYYNFMPDDNDFCSRGERKEVEE